MDKISNCDISALESLIEAADSIAITAHMRPDGDAVGSCTALYHCLQAMHKNAVIVLPDSIPGNLGFLAGTVSRERLLTFEEDSKAAEKAIAGSDLIFSLDYNAFHRTGEMESLLCGSGAKKVLIDHHLNPDRSIFDLVFSETEISSTAEYLFYILTATTGFGPGAGRLPHAAALALMTGMTTDTNNFANSVFPSTLRMASALLGAGVDRDMMLEHLYSECREERIRLQGELLSGNMKIYGEGVALMVLDQATMDRFSLQEGETEGFVNIPLSIGKVRLSCFLKEDKGRIRVSLRSKRGVSANRCAAMYFHGGGHEQAAGGRLSIPDDVSSITEAAEYAEKATRDFMRTGNI